MCQLESPTNPGIAQPQEKMVRKKEKKRKKKKRLIIWGRGEFLGTHRAIDIV